MRKSPQGGTKIGKEVVIIFVGVIAALVAITGIAISHRNMEVVLICILLIFLFSGTLVYCGHQQAKGARTAHANEVIVGNVSHDQDGNLGTRPIVAKMLRLIGATTALIGMAIAIFYGLKIYRQWSSASWPSTTGRILTVDYEEFASRRSEGGAAKLRVAYEYSVAGTVFQSDQICYGVKEFKRDAVQMRALTNQLFQGEVVTVFHKSAAPQEAVIIPSVYWLHALWFGFGIAGGLFGLRLSSSKE